MAGVNHSQGIYTIDNNQGCLSVIPGSSFEYSEYTPNPDISRKANVLFYVDKKGVYTHRDSSMHLALAMADDPYFNVAISSIRDASLSEHADVVIPRFDPPVDYDFLNELEAYDDGSRLFVNSPRAQRYFGDKRYLEAIAREHPEILPKTIVEDNPTALGDFIYNLKKNNGRYVVFKPIRGFGGEGIKKIDISEQTLSDIYCLAYGLSNSGKDEVILQEYIDNVAEYGDKRIHIANRAPVGAVLRKPKDREWLCNQKKGAKLVRDGLTDIDYEIIEKIMPLLESKGVYWAGIDIIGPYLGEINAVSPGLLFAVDALNGQLYGDRSAVRYLADEIKDDVKALTHKRELALAR
ncbi:MAG: hypothetical protein V1740_02275 [Candidatus Woesearchaeota archaeon]